MAPTSDLLDESCGEAQGFDLAGDSPQNRKFGGVASNIVRRLKESLERGTRRGREGYTGQNPSRALTILQSLRCTYCFVFDHQEIWEDRG